MKQFFNLREVTLMSGSAICLLLLCFIDLVYTILVIQSGWGVAEKGPVLGIYYELWGLEGIIFGKVVICGLGIFAVEAGCRIDAGARKRKEIYYTAVLVTFLLLYLVLSVKENIYLLKHWVNI